MPARFRGLAVLIAGMAVALVAGADRIAANTTRDRTISLYGVNTKETLTIQYMKNGKYIPEAMKKIDWALRDWRRDEAIEIDPALIDLVWEIHQELGSNEPIHVICGYRSHGTNEMLRRTVGGQAGQSRHIVGKALDVQFPDVAVKKLRYSALLRERGGVGYYPTSGIPFVHIDTDRVRAWPRLPRSELALLFPSGRTQHLPADGGPLTPEDVRKARAANPELATQIAEFHHERAHPKPPMQIASLAPSLPQLVGQPKLVQRPAAATTQPSEVERARLAALASAPPRLVAEPTRVNRNRPIEETRWGEMRVAAARPDPTLEADRLKLTALIDQQATFVPATAYDEEHPEELSYRPFPIAPFLTMTSSADDPALARMVAPNLAKTLEMLDQTASAPPMRLRPGAQATQLLWAQEFKGEAIDLSGVTDIERASSPPALSRRHVATQAQ